MRPDKLLSSLLCLLIHSACGREEVVVGSDVEFNCSDFVGSGLYDIKWYVPGISRTLIMQQRVSRNETIKPVSRYEERLSAPAWGICQLSNITSGDSEEYECESLHPGDRKQRDYLYTIVAIPVSEPTLDVSGNPVTVGTTVTFTCTPGPNTDGTLQYHFTKMDGAPLTGAVANDTHGTLIIEQVTTDHEGNYTCSITNIAGTTPSSSPVSLLVQLETTTLEETTTIAETIPRTTVTEALISSSAPDIVTNTVESSTSKTSTSDSQSGSETTSTTRGVEISSSTEDQAQDPEPDQLSTAAIVGISVGSVAAAVIIITCLTALALKNRRRNTKWNNSSKEIPLHSSL